jgi:4'-phosphopantetheinyl transferase
MKLAAEEWLIPPGGLRLGADEVHVWRARLNQSEAVLAKARPLLSDDERERVNRFHFKKDRDRFIVARAALRDVLGRYLRVAAGEIKFRYDDYGKPALGGARGGPSFNLAYSNEIALCAVAQSKSVGVDVEHVRALDDWEAIAEHFFSGEEAGALRNLAGDLRPAAFFDYWTHKEAYVKAEGCGLSRPPGGFTISFVEGREAAVLDKDGGHRESSKWSLFGLSPAPGYVGALAVERHVSRLSRWQWRSGELKNV